MQTRQTYIRFESVTPDQDARCNQGVFCAAYDVWYDRPDLAGIWQVREIRLLLNWFNRHLTEPARLFYRANRKAEISGVCWFRSDAPRHISQARYLSWLLNDIGYAVYERRSPDPGRVLWRDRHQIVAAHLL